MQDYAFSNNLMCFLPKQIVNNELFQNVNVTVVLPGSPEVITVVLNPHIL